MSGKKKDLEIVYSLTWRNGLSSSSKREEKKQVSIVALYDIPSTTLKFDVFKSYLLKNSGTSDDVNVYYLMDSGKEYPIKTQTDFEVALYAFRSKARANEVINLILERHPPKMTRNSCDAETQFQTEPESMLSTVSCYNELPPEWFIAGMAQLKLELKEELSSQVSSSVNQAVNDLKLYMSPCLPRRPRVARKSKSDSEDKPSKKTLKMEHKLEHKLEKLEVKASRYREKRLALLQAQKSSENFKSNDSEPVASTSRNLNEDKPKEDKGKETKKSVQIEKVVQDNKAEENVDKDAVLLMMDARPVDVQKSIPHMLGGEIYLHQWSVLNCGNQPWTSLTKLEYTWGSKKLLPLEKILTVPELQPGERGIIGVRLQVPDQAGRYESYWHFTHSGRRFGQWLGVQVIVDPFDLRGNPSVLDMSNQRKTIGLESALAESYRQQASERSYLMNCLLDLPDYSNGELGKAKVDGDADSRPVSPISFCSLSSASSKNDYEAADFQVPTCSSVEKTTSKPQETESMEKRSDSFVVPSVESYLMNSPVPSKSVEAATADQENDSFDDNNNADAAASIKSADDDLDIVVITVPKNEQVKDGFIYVHVDGQKVLIPKNILKAEVVSAAENCSKHSSVESLSKQSASSRASTATLAIAEAGIPKAAENLPEPLIPQQLDPVDLSTADGGACQTDGFEETENYMSHCSAAGSCFSESCGLDANRRLFVFPKDVPGYEVLDYPVQDEASLCAAREDGGDIVNSQAQAQPQNNVPSPVLPSSYTEPVPNFQQTPPQLRRSPTGSDPSMRPRVAEQEPPVAEPTTADQPEASAPPVHTVHILPESLVSGAVSAASTAMHTARSVYNMIRPQAPGTWVNGHWVSASPTTPREANLQALAEMGFWNRDLNATLLARFHDDLNRVVAELVQ